MDIHLINDDSAFSDI